MKNIVIFDLDGTLALIDHRRHMVERHLAFDLWFDTLTHERQLDLRRRFPKEHIEKVTFIEETGWKPDWDAFFDACDKDVPNIPVCEVFLHLNSSHSPHDFELIIFSGRSEVVRDKTETWLDEYGIKPQRLIMRPDKNYEPDEELKAKWLTEIGGPDRVFCVFDDRQKVVDMWRSKGLTCFQVAPGNF